MRTFRRYLLSYLCTLLLPVLVLSVVIYEVVVSYCGAQLIEQNLAAVFKAKIGMTPLPKAFHVGDLPRSEKKSTRIYDNRY